MAVFENTVGEKLMIVRNEGIIHIRSRYMNPSTGRLEDHHYFLRPSEVTRALLDTEYPEGESKPKLG